jgi:hypothetical protein
VERHRPRLDATPPKGFTTHMRKLLLGLAATAAIAAPLAVAGSANADTLRQCETVVTSTVTTTTATFTVLQPKDAVGQFDSVWKHVYTVTVQPDGTFAGTGSITDNNGPVAWTETVSGQFLDNDGDKTSDHVSFATVPVGGGATFAVNNAAMDNTTVPVESTWTANVVEFQIAQPTFETVVTATGETQFANHGEYVAAMGGGKVAAQKCVGMPLQSNKIK